MLLVNFIGALGFSIVIPFMVFLVTRWGGNALVYGLVAATYPAWQFIGAPILGRWSDVYGRRRILLLSGMAASVGSVASIVGLIAGGIVYTAIGETTFVFSAGIIFLTCLLSARLIRG